MELHENWYGIRVHLCVTSKDFGKDFELWKSRYFFWYAGIEFPFIFIL